MKEKDKIEQLTIKLDPELLKKYEYICNFYGHVLNDQITFTMRSFVYNFELNHGPIEV